MANHASLNFNDLRWHPDGLENICFPAGNIFVKSILSVDFHSGQQSNCSPAISFSVFSWNFWKHCCSCQPAAWQWNPVEELKKKKKQNKNKQKLISIRLHNQYWQTVVETVSLSINSIRRWLRSMILTKWQKQTSCYREILAGVSVYILH